MDDHLPYEMSAGYGSGEIKFIVPPGRPYTPIEKLLWPYQIKVWYTLGLLFVVSLSVMLTLKEFGIKSIQCLDLYRIFLGIEISAFPKNLILKYLIALIMLNVLILRNIYQGSLFSTLAHQRNTSHVETMEEMIEKGFTFIFPVLNESFVKNLNISNMK